MSEVAWVESSSGGVWSVSGWPLRTTAPVVCVCVGGWCVAGDQDTTHATLEAAQFAALEGAVGDLGKLKSKIADCEALLTAARRRVRRAEDAALVAAHGEVVWAVSDAGFATLHTATVAGHPCRVEVYEHGGVKWQLEPEHYGHPYTWDAPDVETAKIRAAAAALREPCKRWRVTLAEVPVGLWKTKGGTVEVWAVTHDGALYRAAQALGAVVIGGRKIEGEAVAVEVVE